jgi:REP element-mobilizing transposase RayT
VARVLRTALPVAGVFHVCSRGVERRAIYLDDTDRHFFLALAGMAQKRCDWNVLVYCLMTNHFHVVIDGKIDAITQGMHMLKARYAQSFNHRYERTGHLFQGRFYSGYVEGDETVAKVCDYVLDNPIRAGICNARADWPWLGGAFYA